MKIWNMLNQTGKLLIMASAIVILALALYYGLVYSKPDIDIGEVDNVDPRDVQCIIFCEEQD